MRLAVFETGHKADLFPFFLLKYPQSLVGNRQPILRPSVSESFDFEGEFAVIIGKPGRHIPESEAMRHVAGCSVLMDGSVRDWQKQSVTAGKNFDRSSSLGPWIVTADEVADPHDLHLTTRLNGNLMQETSTSQLAWSAAYRVHYCSSFTTLQTGDVISTGTPGGVGHKRTPSSLAAAWRHGRGRSERRRSPLQHGAAGIRVCRRRASHGAQVADGPPRRDSGRSRRDGLRVDAGRTVEVADRAGLAKAGDA